MKNVLIIDNFDSFVYNLARYVEELGGQVLVKRTSSITLEEIEKINPSHIIISPGPCTPKEAGISIPLVKAFFDKIPILGVCLGHQAIAEAFGGIVSRANKPMHGKSDTLFHQGCGIFFGLPNPLQGARYHSLIVKEINSDCFKITAWNKQSDIMAIQHVRYP